MASSTLQLKVPDDENTPTEKVKAFLEGLDALPGGPRVCPKNVTFSGKAHKTHWAIFQWSKTHVNYSFASNLILQGAKNRLFYFSHPAGTWVGARQKWNEEAWHSWAVALINTGDIGLTMVIYDVDCVTENELAAEGKPWNVKSLTLHRSFFQYWHSKLKRNIRRVYYNQNIEHRGKDKCLGLSLGWMKEMATLGDQALLGKDWTAWHSWAVALINAGCTGLTMAIYDVDRVTKNELAAEGKPWNVKCLTLHWSFFEYWHLKLKRNIRRVYYNQNAEHRGKKNTFTGKFSHTFESESCKTTLMGTLSRHSWNGESVPSHPGYSVVMVVFPTVPVGFRIVKFSPGNSGLGLAPYG